jgi:hypothetical protein
VTRDLNQVTLHEIALFSAQLQAAFDAGREFGQVGNIRMGNPFIGGDLDLSMAWDEGWRQGRAELEEHTGDG